MIMKFNIAFFTHIGTEREINQDRILVQQNIYKNGLDSFSNETYCYCFLADGIGGRPSGDLAAQILLEQINKRIDINGDLSQPYLLKIFESINEDLIQYGINNSKHRGMGTTLVGLIIKDDQFELINAGDSQAWIFRNDLFFKLTEDQVLDPQEDNSPITSYFGGFKNELDVQFNRNLRDILIGDIFMLTSDGLFKCISQKHVKAILSNSTQIQNKANFILKKALENKSEDNLSCILIEIIE